MQGTNIILGYGETLTSRHDLTRTGGPKKYPYDIDEQRLWLGGQLNILHQVTAALPVAAKPRGQSVAKLTLHPTFLAKSHHPNALLAATGLRCIGSRGVIITPRKDTKNDTEPTPTFTAELFVAGTDSEFDTLRSFLFTPGTPKTHQDALRRLELISSFSAAEKNLLPSEAQGKVLLEVVLHASQQDADIVAMFIAYVTALGGEADHERKLVVSGLTFMPVRLAADRAVQLGQFQFVRVLRAMPVLRMGGAPMRAIGTPTAQLPSLPAIDSQLKVGIFDGGIGHTSFSPWASEVLLPGTESTSAEFLRHGNGVTSTVLFGSVDPAATAFPRPYANVKHYRCISPSLLYEQGVQDIDLYSVLKNIDAVLRSEKLDFVNFSLGPYMPMEDEEVHPWTALIDSHLSSGKTFATVAVGNDGNEPWPMSRVQPPSDMVNAIAVGACDSKGAKWARAGYSSYGPGRSPGLIKPDGVSFGGSDVEPFVVYNALAGQLMATQGTSYSAPATLNTAIGVKASLTSPLNMLALRALMNHHAKREKKMPMSEVGRGRFPQSVEEVLQCPDNEVRVIYQGTLTAGQNLRALIPFPTMPLLGAVHLRATLCFASQTDPEHAVNYTRAGLTVILRPNRNSAGTVTFFSAKKMYTTELEARSGDQKWETTLRHEQKFNVETLNDPLFDITYGAREEGQAVDNSTLPPLPYAMVVTVSVEDTPGVYNNIRQRYQTLQPVEIRQEVRIQASGNGSSS
ncbi:S8 family serine peptidase [Pseudoduganella sp. FT93W]|uniref:S8 family serine peptidase n=1 Tax=Duganella fentianensis TaxID=2692177 RepID=A0A845I625_9BURK|nr:S8 family peptidase [Duganella fentianensis]MYN47721.1 S8 family serine peptidase [Duganella fentianensis]